MEIAGCAANSKKFTSVTLIHAYDKLLYPRQKNYISPNASEWIKNQLVSMGVKVLLEEKAIVKNTSGGELNTVYDTKFEKELERVC